MINSVTRRVFGALLLALCVLGAAPVLGATAETPSGVVNVNAASVEQLTLLPRIGPTVAARIVEHREANGPFASKDELMLVRGIGERTFSGLEGYVAIEGKTTLTAKVRLPKAAPADGERN